MKIFLTLALLTLSISSFAKPQICSFDYSKDGSKVGWTAFKTPKKLGVSAKFSDFAIKTTNSKSINDLLATKVVPMTSSFDEAGSKLTLKGSIDVLEFGMKDNLSAITKACYEKHEGVTWPNVDLEFVASIQKSCK